MLSRVEPLNRAMANFAVIYMSLCRFCHLFTHCLGSFLLQDMLLSLHEFAFEGQNMNFTVNMLLTCILHCVPGPALIRTVRKLFLITDIIFVLTVFLWRRCSFTLRKLYFCLQTFLDFLSLDLVIASVSNLLIQAMYMPLTRILSRDSSCSGTFPSRRKI